MKSASVKNPFKSKSGKRQYENKFLRKGGSVSSKGFKFRQCDFLGEPVTFKYKGSSDYGSSLGSICSFIVLLVMMAYLVNAAIMFGL